ncbi:hypothetical protein L484_020492 [Morus notabilis]|uniref:mTERF domain-containing protein 1 n=1 Tax=Morus notabilis TaxID=981085 RepID=W9SJF9_9ROSA|nr:hypothetical protein L484_020492 [Morus notabilis]
MFGLLSRKLRTSVTYNGVILSKSISLLNFLAVTFSSSAIAEQENIEKAHSFTVSYLINSCGLSPEAAISASRKVQFQNPERPDSVLAFFRDQEFSETQILDFIRKRPRFLLTDPNKILLPKLEFFYSKGFSKKDLAKIVSSDPSIFCRSLKNYIIPTYNLFKRVLVSDEQVVSALKHQWISLERHSEDMSYKKVWDGCCEVYKWYGWSEDDVLHAFKVSPHCVLLPEEKIVKTMEFLVNEMVWPAEKIAKCPSILLYSFEKRILPRCLVVKVLLLKGLVKKEDVTFVKMLQCVEKRFLELYVTKYLEEVPLLLSVYQRKVGLEDA